MTRKEIEAGIEHLANLHSLGTHHGLNGKDVPELIHVGLKGWVEAKAQMESNIQSLRVITRMNTGTLECVPEEIQNKYLQDGELACLANVMIQKIAERTNTPEDIVAKSVWEYLPALIESVIK